MQYSEKRKSKIFRGLRPLDPRQGLCPCTPPGALRRAPGPHPKSARAYVLLCALRAHVCPPKKSARAYALAMCAPRTCLPPPPKKKKSARAYALAMCAQRTCLPKKKSARASRSLCALRAHVCPPHNQSLPPSCPPTF